jgi:hypothetical protein
MDGLLFCMHRKFRDSITEVYPLSTSLDLPFDRIIQNEQATEQEIVQVFSEAPATFD